MSGSVSWATNLFIQFVVWGMGLRFQTVHGAHLGEQTGARDLPAWSSLGYSIVPDELCCFAVSTYVESILRYA